MKRFGIFIILLNVYIYAWGSIWQNKNQQAHKLMQQGLFSQAQTTFQHPAWRATAAFRAQDYKTAAEIYASLPDVESLYNLANTLVKLNNYQAALNAYNKVLQRQATHTDARYNRDQLLKFLKQQKKQQNQPNNDNKQKTQDTKSKPKETKSTKSKPKPKESRSAAQQDQDKWLRLIPDDPGALLREKFLRDYWQRHE